MRFLMFLLFILAFASCKTETKKEISNQKDSSIQIATATDSIVVPTKKCKGDFWDVLHDELEERDLKNVPVHILRIIRNEIYAMKLYKFSSQEMLNHFSKYTWYQPVYTNVDSLLSEIDKHNIKILSQAEKNAGNITPEECFQKYYNDPNESEILSILFNEFASPKLARIYFARPIFTKSKKYKYILKTKIMTNEDSADEYYGIIKYSKTGDVLDIFDSHSLTSHDLGLGDQNVSNDTIYLIGQVLGEDRFYDIKLVLSLDSLENLVESIEHY